MQKQLQSDGHSLDRSYLVLSGHIMLESHKAECPIMATKLALLRSSQ